jgi:heat shock protein HslJ
MRAYAYIAAAALALGACASPPGPPGPPAADLAGSDWRIVAVNGRATPPSEYTMRFGDGGAFGAKFGCNLMGGNYILSGATLTVSDLTQTLIGCPEPAASFEAQGSAILQRPMQVAFTSGERMTLGNGAGSITLDPMD